MPQTPTAALAGLPAPAPTLLGRAVFSAQELFDRFPPVLGHPGKALVFQIACPAGARHQGQLGVSRWRAGALPVSIPPAAPRVDVTDDAFDYAPVVPADTPCVEWHLSFANAELFCAYGGPALAQDELQVAEHPALGALREALARTSDTALAPRTREGGVATPVLITGVERRCVIDTTPDLASDRPLGLYGMRFSKASPAQIRSAVTVLDPPTRTNVLAIEAPTGGTGTYALRDLGDALSTAYAGFAAAVLESRRACGDGASTVLHTGHWGAGAYGGDRTAMASMQLLAARLAGLDRVVFHAFDDDGVVACQRALRLLQRLAPAGVEGETMPVLHGLLAERFRWGPGDGN